MKFYIVAGSMYFILGKKKMIFTIIGLFLISLAYEKLHRLVILPQSIDTVIRLSSIQHFGWFAVGALFYEYYIKNSKVYLMAAVVLAILVARHYDRFQSESMVMKLLLILTFVLPLIGNRTVTKILQHKLLMFLGFISYPLYLLHETMMVSMIIKLGVYCPWIPNILLPILPILIVIFLAYIVAQYAEPLLRNTIRHIVKTLQTLKPSAA